MNIKIFTCCHKECPTINTNYIEPIHAGKALSELELNMIGDNTGENISERNQPNEVVYLLEKYKPDIAARPLIDRING